MPTDEPHKCPGQNTMFWRPDDIYDVSCPNCDYAVEFFKTDVKRACPHCSQKILNPKMNFACAEWCDMAEECLGPAVYSQFLEKQELEKRRKSDLEKLLGMVPSDDAEVKVLLERLYRENKDPDQLLDTRQLFLVKEEDESLYRRATYYYSQFVEQLEERPV